NVPGPRYTSYPTVPYWDTKGFSLPVWEESIRSSLKASSSGDGMSIYIHLPFCESLCTYCGCNTRITVNHAVEQPYVKALLLEWQMYLDLSDGPPRICEIHLGGGTPPFFSPENLARLLVQILSTSVISEKAEFSFEAHPGNTSTEHLQTLYDLGFRRISLGIQDFDPYVQELVNRIQPFEKVLAVTEEARRIGYTSVNYDLIYGLPGQTVSSVLGTIKQVSSLKPDRIAFYSYAHIPWIKPGQRKFTANDLPTGKEKGLLYEAGRAGLQMAGYEEIGMDHFALQSDSLYRAAENKQLHRNFMGYTHRYTPLLIGLGVSAISETSNCYAQNEKKVEDYYRSILEGRLPVFKGHVLTAADQILRKHILRIICTMETSWDDLSMQCDEVFDALGRLREMEDDGLLVIGSSSLHVEEKGRPFLRNICMAFDARLWAEMPQSQIFSKTV
ncbi:MAG TPA: oxygen-independent coproporphyrinogen III oxidase, partial [Bacteroidia bacterium]|nr:oxygen-independent coproporphyrinogen III oxidase [Bacteroidia bacterium]